MESFRVSPRSGSRTWQQEQPQEGPQDQQQEEQRLHDEQTTTKTVFPEILSVAILVVLTGALGWRGDAVCGWGDVVLWRHMGGCLSCQLMELLIMSVVRALWYAVSCAG